MSKISPEQLAREWGRLWAAVPSTVQERVLLQAQTHQAELASHFYQEMLGDAVVSQFFSHQQVQERLHSSMQRWITTVFAARSEADLLPIVAQQIHIGEIHARIGIPVHLVLRGARSLKERFVDLLYADGLCWTKPTKSIAYHLDCLFRQNNELEAGRDVLTRLLNRKFLPVVLGKEIHFSRQRNSHFALLAMDIDHFKQVNDQHGHEAGDMVLQQIAAILTNSSRGGDYIFRMGGEEFLVLLVDTQPADAVKMAEKLRKIVAQERFRLPQDKSLQLTISVGVASYRGHPDYQQLLRQADDALYQAKNTGRNRVVQAPTH